MVILLPLLMAYQLMGEAFHEWAGMGMFLTFLIHQILNINWYRNIMQGKYSLLRIIYTVTDLLLLILMIVQSISGILLSRHLFLFLHPVSGIFQIRKIHMLLAYWGYILMFFHLGLHWNMIWNLICKKVYGKNKALITGMKVTAYLITIYGIYAFYKRQFGLYVLGINTFIFFDFEEPIGFFFWDNISIAALCIWCGYILLKFLQKLKKHGTV